MAVSAGQTSFRFRRDKCYLSILSEIMSYKSDKSSPVSSNDTMVLEHGTAVFEAAIALLPCADLEVRNRALAVQAIRQARIGTAMKGGSR